MTSFSAAAFPQVDPAGTEPWRPMELADLGVPSPGGKPDSRAVAIAHSAASSALGQAQPFVPDREPRPAMDVFAVSASVGVPDDVLDSARMAARASGYAKGWASGIAKAREATAAQVAADTQAREEAIARLREQYERALGALSQAAARIDQQQVATANDAQEQIVSAAFSIAEAIVGQAMADDQLRAPAAISRALSLAPADTDLTIRVSPADFAVLSDAQDQTSIEAASSRDPHRIVRTDARRTITIVSDTTVSNGDAVAFGEATEIDARLSAGLDRVREVLGQ